MDLLEDAISVAFIIYSNILHKAESGIFISGVISNNGLLVRAITDILFYTDLIGIVIEIN